MKSLLDTHFLLWIVLGARRLGSYPWIESYRPWGVSPVSLLEIQFLAEVGRLEVDREGFAAAVGGDPRFAVDDLSLTTLVDQALPLSWTRDPFDRLLAAHSRARRIPLITADREMATHHPHLPDEVR